MALVELCGLNEKINLRPVDSLTSFDNDILNYSANFVNNAQLATPPFANVSSSPYFVLNHCYFSPFTPYLNF